ncbi:hypothetical protein KDL29_10465 [bacterium]|nr:hypothetical protein [bacterium]UNM07969.1 MAG: hypothetical protein H7A35_14085 [Planctomycetales bacterium]
MKTAIAALLIASIYSCGCVQEVSNVSFRYEPSEIQIDITSGSDGVAERLFLIPDTDPSSIWLHDYVSKVALTQQSGSFTELALGKELRNEVRRYSLDRSLLTSGESYRIVGVYGLSGGQDYRVIFSEVFRYDGQKLSLITDSSGTE